MRPFVPPRPVLLAALLLAACGGRADVPDASIDRSAAPPTEAPPDGVSAPVPGGTVEVAALDVGGRSLAGTHDASDCGRYFLPAAQAGAVYAFAADGVTVTLMTDAVRRSGEQDLKDVSVFVNGPAEPLVFPRQGGSVRFSDDFRTAEVDVRLRRASDIMGADHIPFRATFRCDPPG